MSFPARIKTAKLNSAKEGRINNKGDVVGDKPAVLILQLEVEEPSAEIVALLARLARTPSEIDVELSTYQLEMVEAR